MSDLGPGFGLEWLPDVPPAPVIPELDSALDHRLGSGRNGLPEPKPYVWNAGGVAREAEVEAQLAAVRAEIAARSGVTSPAPEGR